MNYKDELHHRIAALEDALGRVRAEIDEVPTSENTANMFWRGFKQGALVMAEKVRRALELEP